MLFRRAFHAGIREGSIRTTYRAWKSARVKEGRTYRLDAHGAIEVERIVSCRWDEISDADARGAGVDDRDALHRELMRGQRGGLRPSSRIYCVSFRFVAAVDPREALRNDTDPAALEDVIARLERLDQRSRRGAWTFELLELIARRPGVVSSEIAAEIGRQRTTLKADVRKLKGLGLTTSHDVGYSLSPRGEAIVEILRKR